MIASLQVPILLLGSLIALCNAKPRTNVFTYEPDAEPFQFDAHEGHYLAGTIIGIGVICAFSALSTIMTIVDEIKRHILYNKNLAGIIKELEAREYNFADKEN